MRVSGWAALDIPLTHTLRNLIVPFFFSKPKSSLSFSVPSIPRLPEHVATIGFSLQALCLDSTHSTTIMAPRHACVTCVQWPTVVKSDSASEVPGSQVVLPHIL